MPLGATGDKKNIGRFLRRDRPIANIYVNNQKGLVKYNLYFIITQGIWSPDRVEIEGQ